MIYSYMQKFKIDVLSFFFANFFLAFSKLNILLSEVLSLFSNDFYY